jgi:biotin carboxyl carrier protein
MNKLCVTIGEQNFDVEIGPIFPGVSQVDVCVQGRKMQVTLTDLENVRWLMVEDRPYEIDFDQDLRWLRAKGQLYTLEIRDQRALAPPPLSGDGRVKAPIPGMITRIYIEAQQQVEAGQPLLVLEAMKMQNEIRAPRTGVVRAVQAQSGQTVPRGHLLLEID